MDDVLVAKLKIVLCDLGVQRVRDEVVRSHVNLGVHGLELSLGRLKIVRRHVFAWALVDLRFVLDNGFTKLFGKPVVRLL